VLTLLMRYPEILSLVDVQLDTAQLEPINDNDFAGTNRLIWLAWLEMSAHPELEIGDVLPADLLEQIHTWITSPLPDMPLDQWARDAVRTVLRLREKRLRDISRHTQSLVAEAQGEGDLKAERYLATLQGLSETLCRVQQALSR